MKYVTLLAAVAAGSSPIVSAQTERDLEKHEHGSATMNIAIDDSALFLELDSPWNNLVGFEHKPETDEQQALVDESLSLLQQPETLFALNGGDCVVDEVVIDSSLGAMHSEDEHHDEHGEEHEHHDEDEHHEEG